MAETGRPRIGALKFTVLAPIAMGSTARVDLCRLTQRAGDGAPEGTLVAVKRLLPEVAGDAKTARRFLDEVWMTAALNHPNVVRVLGWGEDKDGAFLAVELVQGVSMARLFKTVVETREEFPDRLVAYAGMCIARGLDAAHALKSDKGELLGLVHRDLTLGNVLVGFNGDVKIADFGLAKAKDRLSQTTTGLPERSMGHISPEDLLNGPVDHRADIFSLGVILYELLAGKPPFAGADEIETAERVLKGTPISLGRMRRRMDAGLSKWVESCLAKAPAERPQAAGLVARACEEWLGLRGKEADAKESLARFVRRNAMKQMRWFERVIHGGAREGEPAPELTQLTSTVMPWKVSHSALTPPSDTTIERGASDAPRGPAPRPTPPRPDREDRTAIEGGRPKPRPAAPQPRASRVSGNPGEVRARRRRESASGFVDPAAPRPQDSDDGEDIPTVAMPRDEMSDMLWARAPVAPQQPEKPSGDALVAEVARFVRFAQRAAEDAEELKAAAERAEEEAKRAEEARRIAERALDLMSAGGALDAAERLLVEARALIDGDRD